jgi:hypothetical protein
MENSTTAEGRNTTELTASQRKDNVREREREKEK